MSNAITNNYKSWLIFNGGCAALIYLGAPIANVREGIDVSPRFERSFKSSIANPTHGTKAQIQHVSSDEMNFDFEASAFFSGLGESQRELDEDAMDVFNKNLESLVLRL